MTHDFFSSSFFLNLVLDFFVGATPRTRGEIQFLPIAGFFILPFTFVTYYFQVRSKNDNYSLYFIEKSLSLGRTKTEEEDKSVKLFLKFELKIN